jgi:hypothetical protein
MLAILEGMSMPAQADQNQRSLVIARPVFHVLEKVLGSGGPRTGD